MKHFSGISTTIGTLFETYLTLLCKYFRHTHLGVWRCSVISHLHHSVHCKHLMLIKCMLTIWGTWDNEGDRFEEQKRCQNIKPCASRHLIHFWQNKQMPHVFETLHSTATNTFNSLSSKMINQYSSSQVWDCLFFKVWAVVELWSSESVYLHRATVMQILYKQCLPLYLPISLGCWQQVAIKVLLKCFEKTLSEKQLGWVDF